MLSLYFDGVARVVAVHGKGGDEDRAVHAHRFHGRHHFLTGDVIGPVRDAVPGPFRGVGLIRVDLRIYYVHWRCLLSGAILDRGFST